MKEKKRNYWLRSKVYRTTGYATIGLTTIGGVSAYKFLIQPGEQVTEDLETAWAMFMDNIWIEQTGYRLNLILALPYLIGIIVFLIVILKKNKAYFNDKISLGLLITILTLYSIYSLIGYAMSSLIGALIGTLAFELVFEPLSLRAKEEADFIKELKKEKRKEKVRREVRNDDLDGIV